MALIDNIVGFWNLDESSGDAVDASGGGLTLTETSGTIDAGTIAGKGARDFEAGDTEYFTRATSAALERGTSNLSVAAWIKLESTNSGPFFTKWGSTAFDAEWYFWVNTDLLRVEVCDNLGNTAGNQWNAASLSTGTAYFCSWGWNTTGPEFWLSLNAGTPTVRTDVPVQAQSSTGNLYMGSAIGTASFFDGMMCCAGIWKRDIRSDLTTLYNSGTPMNWADMGGGGGASATRGTPFGHRGTAFNGGRTMQGPLMSREHMLWREAEQLDRRNRRLRAA